MSLADFDMMAYKTKGVFGTLKRRNFELKYNYSMSMRMESCKGGHRNLRGEGFLFFHVNQRFVL